ncbi:unnamed protein product [Symbiodinium sp. KB8]|nr:unnamed protein product [Symbiodinium sp. KB8]
MVDGFGGVVDIMDDLGDIVNDASFTVAQLSGNISALGAEVKSVNQPGTDDLADRVWTAGNTTQDTSDLLSSASSIVGTFGADITRQLDDFKSQVDAYAVTIGMAYASVLAVSVVFMAVTLLPIGLCTCCYKVSVVPNFLLIFLLWLVTGILMVLSTGLSDMCLNPGPSHSIVNIAKSTNAVGGEVMDTLEYYLLCEPGVNGTNVKGLYQDIVRFQNDALSASRSVESVKDDVETQTASFPPGPRDDINRRLGVVQEGVWGMGNVTVDLVRLASCESLGGRVYRPVIKALCEDFVGKGFASLWAVHVAAGVFLALILVAGVRLCNSNRHPGGSKSREAVKARALAAQSTLSGTNPVATAHPVQAQPASVSGGAVELSPEHHSQPLASAPGQPFADHVVRK